jgi:hypothetical protein
MRLHFDIGGVRKLLAHTKVATEHSPNYEQNASGEPVLPGLWIVGDQGVYLMSNGRPDLMPEPIDPAHPERRFVVYAREIDPTRMAFDVWYANKRMAFGGDDGCDYLAASDIEAALADQGPNEPLVLDLTPARLKLMTVTRTKRKTA